MATKHNSRESAKYPTRFNKRENKASTHNYSAVQIDDTDSPYTVATDDATNFIVADSTSGAITVNLPATAENKGRCITVRDSNGTSGTTVDGNTLNAADEWVELFCTGSAWIVTKSRTA